MSLLPLLLLSLCVPGEVNRSPLQTVKAFNTAYDERDLRGVRAVLAPDAVVRDDSGEITGADVLQNYASYVFKVDPPFVATQLDSISTADLVAETIAFTGGGQDPLTSLNVYRVAGGCIVEMTSNLSAPE
ncbi:MAG: nuclear transport factor 2 family protein [Brevundimonas sp.]|uniref:nuclear transport factor 2 family protein n=1 Tax=Brevundimonas sp. TaxID=1871086 RepID=UPI002AB83213|nr:nuclear transport factor 2 family protein [Brevundimonas sp.]MDZ4109334.1 nuclear transport factor 2 family protein [Brevundimonas sp.]